MLTKKVGNDILMSRNQKKNLPRRKTKEVYKMKKNYVINFLSTMLIITIILYPLIQKFGYAIEEEYKGNKILTRYF